MASRPLTAPHAHTLTPEQNGFRYGLLTAAVLCIYTLAAARLGFFSRIEAGSLDVLILIIGSVMAIGHERDGREACRQVGHRSHEAAVGKAALLLVLLAQRELGLDAAGLDAGEVGPDEVHKVLALELFADAGFEVGRGFGGGGSVHK